MFALNRILVPSNLGDPSKTAIKYGVAFARQFNAQLFVLHVLGAQEFDAVIETERVLENALPEDPTGTRPRLERAEIARQAAREELGSLLDEEEARDTKAEYLLRSAGTAGPGEEILICAQQLDVELITMGKHRLSFVEHLVAGSVTEKVMRRAPCPVLIVHYPEHDFVVQDDG